MRLRRCCPTTEVPIVVTIWLAIIVWLVWLCW